MLACKSSRELRSDSYGLQAVGNDPVVQVVGARGVSDGVLFDSFCVQ